MSKKDEPFLDQFSKEINDLLNHFSNDPFSSFFEYQSFQIHMFDTGDEILIEADLPGYDQDQIKVTMEQGGIKISVDESEELETFDEKTRFYHKRSQTKTLERFIHIPTKVDPSPIVTYTNGILTIQLEKR